MVRMARILCPIDFSEFSRHALDHAVGLAKWYGSTVSMLFVHRLPTPAVAAGPVVVPEAFVPMQLTGTEREQILQRMEELASADRAAGATVDTIIVEGLNVAETIVDQADQLDVDLIVLGTHGRSGFRRLVLGSVAEKVLRTAARPVMIVAPRAPDAVPREPLSMREIVCPVDFSPSAARALEYATSFAGQTKARVTVVHVVQLLPELAEIPPPDFAGYHQMLLENARRHMADLLTPAVRSACEIEELILTGTAYREILRLASERHADLIVMGVQGRGPIDLAFFGSTAQHVVRQATCPVVTLRARDE
jgi:nucleotide-binding universal stress UspA family protein